MQQQYTHLAPDYRLVVDGEEVLEMDAIHMIEKTGGVDLMEKVRSILGI